MSRNSEDRRRYVEAASMGLLLAAAFAGKRVEAKHAVNEALELWDEIEEQCPRQKEDR